MANVNYLKKSDCELQCAENYPGRWYRQNDKGSIEFNTKEEWVENEARKWHEQMRENTKYDNTAIYRKADCLAHHLRKLKVSVSEARKLIVKFEDSEVPNNSEVGETNETEDLQDAETMDTNESFPSQNNERNANIVSQQDMFAMSDDEENEIMNIENQARDTPDRDQSGLSKDNVSDESPAEKDREDNQELSEVSRVDKEALIERILNRPI